MNAQWTLNGLSRISTTNCIAASRLHTIIFFSEFVNMLTEKHNMCFSYSYNNVRRSRKNFLKPSLPPNLKVIEERSSQSDLHCVGGGPRVVVSTAAFHARVRGSVPGRKKTKNVSSPPTCESQYCGEPP